MYRSIIARPVRARLLVVCFTLLTLTPVFGTQANGQANGQVPDPNRPSGLPELLGTSRPSFDIPFSVGQTDGNIVLVVLNVSTDAGKTWQNAVSRSPTDKSFPYTASGEGEFWFAIQSVFRDGSRKPADDHLKPELRIAVDQQQPELEFSVRSDSAGRIVGTVLATDRNINPRSLVIEYQAFGEPNGASWQSVPAASSRNAVGGQYQDELAWWPMIQASEYTVRATISDVAGNTTTLSRRLVASRPGTASIAGSVAATGNGGSIARNTATPNKDSPGQTHYQASRMPVALENLYGPSPAEPDAGAREASLRSIPEVLNAAPPVPGDLRPSPPEPKNGNVGDNKSFIPNRVAENAPDGSPLATSVSVEASDENKWRSRSESSPGSSSQVAGNTTLVVTAVNENVAHAGLLPDAPGTGIKEQAPVAEVARQSDPSTNPLGTPGQVTVATPRQDVTTAPAPGNPQNAVWSSSTTSLREDLPPPRPSAIVESGPAWEQFRKIARHSNSHQFQMEYEIDAIGPEGARDVELWVTVDGARSWQKLVNDPDCRSPANVSVDADGIYGFRIRVISNEGLASRSPREGDAADVWINVDTKTPGAQLIGAPYGNGRDAGQLIVQWRAEDSDLGITPVRLGWSTLPDGPWTTIVHATENDGEFAWSPAVDTPEMVFLRLEVRDEAGNCAIDQTRQPVDLSGLIPRGHIRGITPIKPAETQPPEPGHST
jgi:hypothetical protein